MRALSIQVQPERATGMDVDGLIAAFAGIAAMTEVVEHHQFDQGHDKGPYLNFTFGTRQAATLWREIRTRLYEDESLGPHLKAASMAMCSSETGWHDYVMLYHYDPAVAVEPDALQGL